MKAVLWDLDDTLLDTLDHRMKALVHAHERCVGGSIDARALWRSHRGRTLEELAIRLLGADHRRFTEAYREYYFASVNPAYPYEGIREVLTWCRSSGLLLGVVTSKVSWGATDELARSGLLQYFRTVVAYDDTDAHKPDPAPIFEALERLDIQDAREAMFVGDSPADVLAARNAGCRSVAALWGTLDPELVHDAGPDDVAVTPSDVVALVAREVTT